MFDLILAQYILIRFLVDGMDIPPLSHPPNIAHLAHSTYKYWFFIMNFFVILISRFFSLAPNISIIIINLRIVLHGKVLHLNSHLLNL